MALFGYCVNRRRRVFADLVAVVWSEKTKPRTAPRQLITLPACLLPASHGLAAKLKEMSM